MSSSAEAIAGCQRIRYAVANGGTKFCGKPAVVIRNGTALCKEHAEPYRVRRG